MATLEDRFVGCLLGLALGDAMGAPFEGSFVARAAWKLVCLPTPARRRTTDDTEMAVILARSLAEHGGAEADALASAWATGARWSRGCGAGASALLRRIRAGEDRRTANRSVFPDGSFGNGAAMRAAPIGLWHHDEPMALLEAATRAPSITHAHPLGIEGGVLIARATAMALAGDLDLEMLRAGCREAVFRDRPEAAGAEMDEATVVRELGHSVSALESVVTAIHVARRFASFGDLMQFVIALGGDTDTIGAMAGAIFGARHGVGALPVDGSPASRTARASNASPARSSRHAARARRPATLP